MLFVIAAGFALCCLPRGVIAQDEIEGNPLLELGTEDGPGGEDFMRFDRNQIRHQIKTFIPPLLRPAFVGHAFVLPPGLASIQITNRTLEIEGDDFFLDGDTDSAGFRHSRVERNITDLSIFYGFDLNRKYLHGFTARLNIPYMNSKVSGHVHPFGVQSISAFNSGSTQEVGDIGLFLKKKILDQGNDPVGLAIVGGIFFPTGKNDEKFGDDGTIRVQMGAAPPTSSIFARFSDDGRLPSTLQPGTGTFSYMLGVVMTRQFDTNSVVGRSALHLGVKHKFVFENDGVDAGDTTTFFASFVKPVYKDYLSADLTFVMKHHEDDSYDGKIMNPATMSLVNRPSFSGGTTAMLAPSLIYSPDPQIRLVGSFLFRVVEPDHGPAPGWVLRLGIDVTF